MGQARKDKAFKQVVSAFSDVRTNVFYGMDELHIQQVFEILTDKFGFPRKWQMLWKQHRAKSPSGENEIALFLCWGNKHIDPILNPLLLRGELHSTFAKLCEYVVNRSPKKK